MVYTLICAVLRSYSSKPSSEEGMCITYDAKIKEFEFRADFKNMGKCFIITLIDFDQKFRQITKFAIFLFKTVSTDNSASCKESRDLKKINIDFKRGTRIWRDATFNLKIG